MEPSPTQSLISSYTTVHTRQLRFNHCTEWDANTTTLPPRSPTTSEDSGCGKDYYNQLGISFSDEGNKSNNLKNSI